MPDVFSSSLKRRANGAAAVVAKAASERELVRDLRVVFDGGAIWDRRAETV
jgi:hypothetical protein